MTARPNIDARLENWGNAMAGARPRGGVDTADAWRVESAWRQLPERHRMLLRLCYIKGAQPEEIYRKLAIPRRATDEFTERLSQAKAAIEEIVTVNNSK